MEFLIIHKKLILKRNNFALFLISGIPITGYTKEEGYHVLPGREETQQAENFDEEVKSLVPAWFFSL